MYIRRVRGYTRYQVGTRRTSNSKATALRGLSAKLADLRRLALASAEPQTAGGMASIHRYGYTYLSLFMNTQYIHISIYIHICLFSFLHIQVYT